ncbi:putative bifunctional diguanylate cyclase/phosphodiesterase [Chamaesiphon sp.]|uniref:putative bifunctional diguanylate cyclase/phosphodiesterase n=1 Tax=Chamaesiphon sp. TaxID=2814140 RepID=UPI0035930AFC
MLLCSSPSPPQLKPELLAEIVQALAADGGRLLILAKPPAQRAQLYRYGLQPSTATPIEKNALWQQLLYPHTTTPPIGVSSATLQPLNSVCSVDNVFQQAALSPLLHAFELVGIESLLILPLRYHRQCVGCLTLFRANSAVKQDLRWTEAQLQLAQNLAAQLYITVMQQRVDRIAIDRAYYDTLTGLPHRQLLDRWLTLALAKMPTAGETLVVIIINLDRFKNINDRLGHRVGDRLLQLITHRLENAIGTEAIIGRWSGDEFMLIIPNLAAISTIDAVADRVLNCFALPFVFEQDFPALATNSLYIKASMGIAIATSGGADSEILLQQADAALELAQHHGKNNYEIYQAIANHPDLNRLQLENILDCVCAALTSTPQPIPSDRPVDERKLLLYYQPQIDTHTGEIIGVEALLRCQDLHAKIINPIDLISIAEETGAIVQIGEWVIRAACIQKKIWQDLGLGDFPIAVNFSVKQLQEPNLVETITAILVETGLSPAALEVEITESIAIKDLELTIAILAALRGIGVKIALDDFGTGYSSLAALKYLPLDRLKIDRSFMCELQANTIDAGIVRTIVNLGHQLQLNVIAEGVETIEQLEFLRSINCDAVQGFLFSHPVSASDFEAMITRDRDWHYDRSHPPN